MKVLITGITGFAGSHLADLILENYPKVEVHGTKRWRSKTDNINHLVERVKFHECDIKDSHNMDEIISRVRPDRIFHLAAQSFVPTSWKSPTETLQTNIIGQANLFEAVRKAKYDPLILIAGSSEEYGLVHKKETPVTEENPLRPLSPYAVSKVCQDFMGYQYFESYGMKIVRTRAFNHSGPRRGEVFVDSDFAKQIAEIENQKRKPLIEVGNLDAVRDFTDVRDIVEAYWSALESCDPGDVYNIASGKGVRIGDMLEKLISLSRQTDIKAKPLESKMRPSDVPILVGDSSKFSEKTGWKPKINYIERTLPDTLDYWRERV